MYTPSLFTVRLSDYLKETPYLQKFSQNRKKELHTHFSFEVPFSYSIVSTRLKLY